MRGHIGFKIGNRLAPTVRITEMRAAILITEIPAPTIRITALRSAILVGPPPAAPSAPVFVTAGSIDAYGTIELLFPQVLDNGAPLTGYTVQHSTNGSTWTTLNVSVAAVESDSVGVIGRKRFLVAGLTLGTEYAFRIAAINSVGTGPFSENAFAIPTTTNDLIAFLTLSAYYGAATTGNHTSTSTNLYGRTIVEYKAPYSHSTTQPISIAFQPVIMIGSQSSFEDTDCTTTALSNCNYTYDYQVQEATGAPQLQNWISVQSPAITIYDDQDPPVALHTLNKPQILAYVPSGGGFSGLTSYTYGTKLRLRCVITRNADAAIAVTDTVFVTFTDNWLFE